ncbi:hypothetical protein FOA52_005554 [Chlamydomonas sp. UWO 241]|nr:hypothetical protein FOA52_005554 [Chlamydomonas sp. UWO 241]
MGTAVAAAWQGSGGSSSSSSSSWVPAACERCVAQTALLTLLPLPSHSSLLRAAAAVNPDWAAQLSAARHRHSRAGCALVRSVATMRVPLLPVLLPLLL